MNRQQRRKFARHATVDETMPPDQPHGPIQQTIRDDLIRVMTAIEPIFPGHLLTIFAAEKGAPVGESRLPRFNYISNADRPDMIAALEAWIARQKAQGATLDKINEAPPTETRQ